MPYTIMMYNIERGFHSPEHVLEKSRLEAAQRVVQVVNPDILALTEACYGGPNSKNIRMDYLEIFGFPYGKFCGFDNQGLSKMDHLGNCLLSRFPMKAKAIRLAYKGAVRGRIQLEDKILTVDVVHPSYSVDDSEKIRTLHPLLETWQEPYIITGDFNTVHPEDNYDWKQVRQELLHFDSERASLIVENWRRAELVSWLLELGLQDAFSPAERETTVPTSNAYINHTTGVRMDFFFMSAGFNIKESYVLKNEDTKIASDHYPVVSVFDISK